MFESLASCFAFRCSASLKMTGKRDTTRTDAVSGLERAPLDFKVAIMRVLAIDASLRNTGVAIVDANNGTPRSIYFGTIHNASSMRSSSCLVAFRDRLVKLIREHEPDCCA